MLLLAASVQQLLPVWPWRWTCFSLLKALPQIQDENCYWDCEGQACTTAVYFPGTHGKRQYRRPHINPIINRLAHIILVFLLKKFLLSQHRTQHNELLNHRFRQPHYFHVFAHLKIWQQNFLRAKMSFSFFVPQLFPPNPFIHIPKKVNFSCKLYK